MEYQYAGEPKRIIEAACKTAEFDLALIRTSFALDKLSAAEWFALCELLHLSPDSLSYGYCLREHEAWLFAAGKRVS